MMLSDLAVDKIISFKPKSLLDVGMGEGLQARRFLDAGINVTSIDFGVSEHFCNGKGDWMQNERFTLLQGDFMSLSLSSVDCLWASHILEHMRNPGLFLDKCFKILSDDGIFAVTVPPLKHDIVGGHLSLWNPGLLLYNMILAGFNCKDAWACQYGYNISVIVRKVPIVDFDFSTLVYDWLDVSRLSAYFPFPAVDGFNGSDFEGLVKVD